MTTSVDTFEEHRPTLLGLACRLLGSRWDAEDVVQDAYLRWSSTARGDVRDPRAYLMTTVTHLCTDLRTSARARRETCPGPRLPEPVATGLLGPLESAELLDAVAHATRHLMERLNPAERAVFVLRQAFHYSYDDIAPVVGTSAVNCRQLHRRAALKLEQGADRFTPGRDEHTGFVTTFVNAARAGDLGALLELLKATTWEAAA